MSERAEHGDGPGGAEAESVSGRELVLAAEQEVVARLAAHREAVEARKAAPQGNRVERARDAVARAWTERGDRKLYRQAKRAGMLDDPMYAGAIDGIDPDAELEAITNPSPEAQEEAAVARAHAVLDAPVERPGGEVEEARDAVERAQGVPSSDEVATEPARRVHGEPYVPPGHTELMGQIDEAVPEPSNMKKRWWRVADRFRRN